MEIRKRNNVHVIDAIRPDAPVLVYAHGFGCSQHMWRHITPAFEGKCRQVLFDYVGCGQSDLAAFDLVKYASLTGYPYAPVFTTATGAKHVLTRTA